MRCISTGHSLLNPTADRRLHMEGRDVQCTCASLIDELQWLVSFHSGFVYVLFGYVHYSDTCMIA